MNNKFVERSHQFLNFVINIWICYGSVFNLCLFVLSKVCLGRCKLSSQNFKVGFHNLLLENLKTNTTWLSCWVESALWRDWTGWKYSDTEKFYWDPSNFIKIQINVNLVGFNVILAELKGWGWLYWGQGLLGWIN